MKKLALALILAHFSTLAAATPIFVDSDGRQWIDMSPYHNLSWIDVATVCSSATGHCEGVVDRLHGSSTDLTGLTWATKDEVVQLIHEMAGVPLNDLHTGLAEYPYPEG